VQKKQRITGHKNRKKEISNYYNKEKTYIGTYVSCKYYYKFLNISN